MTLNTLVANDASCISSTKLILMFPYVSEASCEIGQYLSHLTFKKFKISKQLNSFHIKPIQSYKSDFYIKKNVTILILQKILIKNLVFFFTFSHHNNQLAPLFPHHSPKIVNCVFQGTLSCYVCVLFPIKNSAITKRTFIIKKQSVNSNYF